MGNFRLNQEYEQDEGLYLSNDFSAVGKRNKSYWVVKTPGSHILETLEN